MGKKLIIKGADFSENAVDVRVIEWYITQYTDYGGSASSVVNVVNGGWAYQSNHNSLIQGKLINALKFKAAAAGTLNLYKGKLNSTSKPQIGSVSVSQSEVGTAVIKTFTPYTMGANEYLIIGEPNSSASFYFTTQAPADSSGFYTKVPSEWSSTALVSSLCVDVGYIEPE